MTKIEEEMEQGAQTMWSLIEHILRVVGDSTALYVFCNYVDAARFAEDRTNVFITVP
jgi:hypothetical protein